MTSSLSAEISVLELVILGKDDAIARRPKGYPEEMLKLERFNRDTLRQLLSRLRRQAPYQDKIDEYLAKREALASLPAE